MTKRLKVILFFFVFAFGSLTMWLVRGQSRQNTPVQMPHPYALVDEKARAVKNADEKAIGELADAVLQMIIADRVPSVFVQPYKEQIVRAEINYRSGLKQGVPEANIVRVIEELAQKLSAPDYARTDEVEVHDMRLTLSYMMPHFIVHQPLPAGEDSSMAVPFTINPTMSPLEAVYVTRFLIMQKEINESSLLTPAERAEMRAAIEKLGDAGTQLTRRQRGAVMTAMIDQKLHPEKPQQTTEELAARAKRELAEQTNIQYRAVLTAGPSSPRYKEMQEVVQRAYSIKVSDAVVLANRSLELLGIED